jgi:hypothetical protein
VLVGHFPWLLGLTRHDTRDAGRAANATVSLFVGTGETFNQFYALTEMPQHCGCELGACAKALDMSYTCFPFRLWPTCHGNPCALSRSIILVIIPLQLLLTVLVHVCSELHQQFPVHLCHVSFGCVRHQASFPFLPRLLLEVSCSPNLQ